MHVWAPLGSWACRGSKSQERPPAGQNAIPLRSFNMQWLLDLGAQYRVLFLTARYCIAA